MRLSRTIAGAFVAAVVAAAVPSSGAAAAAGRAVSLKMLQASLRAGDSRFARSFCGITRLTGFLADRNSKDIILFGEVGSGRPALNLDDFAVALRTAKFVYARREGRTLYYTPPGCSIDPSAAVLKRLQEIGPDTGDGSALREWEAVGSSPQNVRVMGVPFDSRFARVMVEADYDMKRLVNGSVELGIKGFESLMSMRVAIAEQRLRESEPDDGGGMSMNRFWFCPDECTYTEADGAVTLGRCRVRLLTEEQFVAANGKATGAGRSSELAQRFAEAFTAKYADIAARRPIYAELEGLFRFVALAKLLEERRAEAISGARLDFLVGPHRVGVVHVARQVPGLTRVQTLSHRPDGEDGYTVRTVALLTCGGVSMDVRTKRIAAPRPRHTTEGGKSLRAGILEARPAKGALYWDFPKPGSRAKRP